MKIALSRGYRCEKSPLYSDIELGTAREVDLKIFKYGPDRAEYSHELELLFECKKSEKPLLVLCSHENLERHDIFWDSEVIMNKGPNALIYACSGIRGQNHKEREKNIGRFAETVPVGYSIVPAFQKSDENIYKGIMALAKAYEYYRKEYIKFFQDARIQKHVMQEDLNQYMLIVPVMVIDAPLYNVTITDGDGLNVSETTWASLLIRPSWNLGTDDEHRKINIQVIKKDFLNEFLISVEQLHNYISNPEFVLHDIKIQTNWAQKCKAFLRRLFKRNVPPIQITKT